MTDEIPWNFSPFPGELPVLAHSRERRPAPSVDMNGSCRERLPAYASRLACLVLRVTIGGCVGAQTTTCLPAAVDACPRFAPEMALELEDIYHDRRASVPDVGAEERNNARLKPLTDFMQYVERQVDDGGVDNAETTCAFAAFRTWAAAGALTQQPFVKYSRQGTVARNQHLIGLLVVALKLRQAGFAPDSGIIGWLRALTYQDLDFFERATNRGNLYYWSGAASALLALLSHDRRALGYQEQVWQAAIVDIRNDGTIAGEMARGQRALIYHMYAFSALLMLRAARASLGLPTGAAAGARLERLASVIGRTLCNPAAMGEAADAAIERPGDWAYRVPIGLGDGLLGEDWRRCGNMDADTRDITFGGDTRATAAVLRAGAPSAHQH